MKHCKFESCQEDWNVEKPDCQCGEPNYKNCQNYIGNIESEPIENVSILSKESISIAWHSNAMGSIDLELITAKKQPIIIGVVGQAKAGKTTILATLYMLLRNGENVGSYNFAGSYTLLGWEKLAHFLSFHTHKKLYFPPHTSSNSVRLPGLLHILLKDKNGQFQDILFTDAPGEWFTDWSNSADSDESKGARWVDDNADGFIVVADSEAFKNSLGKARSSLLNIVERMRNTHRNRPTALVWAKSVTFDDKEVKNRISDKVILNLPNTKVYDVAVIDHTTNDLLRNILLLTNQILIEIQNSSNQPPEINIKNSDDFFFTIR